MNKCPKEILIESLGEKGQRNLEAFLKDRVPKREKDRVPKREKVLVLKTKDGFRKTKKN